MKLSKISTVVILSHFNERSDKAGFPPQLIRDYFLKENKTIVYIEHAFPHANDKRSSMTIYVNGKIKTKEFTFGLSGPAPLFYIVDVFLTWYFLLKVNITFDLCIALDNLNVFSVYPFKVFGRIKKLIYYTIDYTPYRFPNKVLNSIYHLLDKFACYSSDRIWILSNRMIYAREKNGVDIKKSAPNILLPMGADVHNIQVVPFKKINKYQLVFLGHLLEKQGIQVIIEALPNIIKKIPKIKFIIIGHGAYKNTLIQLSKSLHVEKYISFIGFLEYQKDVENLLCHSSIGLAPYITDSENYTYYTDPGKPKLYLACGLPVIITDIPESARIIEKAGAGLCIPYKKEAFEKAVITLLKDEKIYTKYRNNAIRLSKKFDMNTLIKNAIEKT